MKPLETSTASVALPQLVFYIDSRGTALLVGAVAFAVALVGSGFTGASA